MAGGYLVSEQEHVEDGTTTTKVQELSLESPCGATEAAKVHNPILPTIGEV